MQKTRLGISVSLLGFIMCLSTCIGGFIPMLIVGGYILLLESNEWLRRLAVKAIVIELGISLVTMLIGLIPNFVSMLNYIFNIFGSSFSVYPLTSITSTLTSACGIIEIVVFAIMAIKALSQGSLRISFVEKFVHKHTQNNNMM